MVHVSTTLVLLMFRKYGRKILENKTKKLNNIIMFPEDRGIGRYTLLHCTTKRIANN